MNTARLFMEDFEPMFCHNIYYTHLQYLEHHTDVSKDELEFQNIQYTKGRDELEKNLADRWMTEPNGEYVYKRDI